MKLFISWSGQSSQQIANELRKWSPLILPAVKPFITTTDIEKGAQWQGVIRDELEKSSFGLVVLTRENLDSQWIAFEAGALSKHLSGRVATVLFDIGHSDVKAPLRIFQGTVFGEQDFRKLIGDINEAVEPEQRRSDDELDQLFPMLWPSIEKPV
ncbi:MULTISPECIES: TIR domain-containing protein [unclassified Bradyrhizobium]|uniref:TIR domain-containing protein n=1 Tax=unclassified Bradyrhizobium TaxID=2631580 RepID=UPI0028E6D5E4|nr:MULTISPECIES: TIR domain-containing protein [unclassified Bradyrhizobium]